MKSALTKNWLAKLASLLAAYAMWYVIKEHINENGNDKFSNEKIRDDALLQQKLQELYQLQEKINNRMDATPPPKASIVPEEEDTNKP
jgi:CHASE1-domain containing sensor protein